jgi:hypothetical protein
MRDERTYLRQLRAAMTAEYNLQTRIAKIKWEEDVLLPALANAAAQIGTTGELPTIEVEASS